MQVRGGFEVAEEPPEKRWWHRALCSVTGAISIILWGPGVPIPLCPWSLWEVLNCSCPAFPVNGRRGAVRLELKWGGL